MEDRINIVFDNTDDCDKWCSIKADHWWWISVWWNAKRENDKIVSINRTRDGKSFSNFLKFQENSKAMWKDLSKDPELSI